MRLTVLTGRHRSTIWKVLKRHGMSRRRRPTRQTFKRFECSQPGALLHIDAYSAPKFDQPGHRVTGDRDKNNRARGLGKTVVIAVQDDHTRLVYAELHGSENAENVSITLKRGAAWMREHGCGPSEAVMSDNAKCYARSHALAESSPSSAPATSSSRPTHHAGTARSSGSSARSKTSGRTPASDPTAPPATARSHPSSDTPTATDLTAPPAADRPSPASTKSASRTTSAGSGESTGPFDVPVLAPAAAEPGRTERIGPHYV